MQKKIIKLSTILLIIFIIGVFFSSLNKNSIYDTKNLVGQKMKNIKLNHFSKNKINNVWMSHADQVSKLPKNFNVVASTKNSKYTIIENKKKNFFGVQFHPEVTHTNKGKILLKNFVIKICKAKRNWSSKHQKIKLINDVRKQVGTKNTFSQDYSKDLNIKIIFLLKILTIPNIKKHYHTIWI